MHNASAPSASHSSVMATESGTGRMSDTIAIGIGSSAARAWMRLRSSRRGRTSLRARSETETRDALAVAIRPRSQGAEICVQRAQLGVVHLADVLPRHLLVDLRAVRPNSGTHRANESFFGVVSHTRRRQIRRRF